MLPNLSAEEMFELYQAVTQEQNKRVGLIINNLKVQKSKKSSENI